MPFQLYNLCKLSLQYYNNNIYMYSCDFYQHALIWNVLSDCREMCL